MYLLEQPKNLMKITVGGPFAPFQALWFVVVICEEEGSGSTHRTQHNDVDMVLKQVITY